MSQPQGGQGVAGGANLDEVRRRFQQGGGFQPRTPMPAGGPDVAPGGQNPAPPSAPTTMAAPVQQPMTITAPRAQWNPLDANEPVNPYRPPGGTGPKSAQPNDAGGAATPAVPAKPAVEPGAPIGPGAPRPSRNAGGGRQDWMAKGGGTSAPTPQNPSPQGPRGNAGPMIRPAAGAPPAGGFQTPGWGGPRSGSVGVGNLPATPVQAPGSAGALPFGAGSVGSVPTRAAAPQAGGAAVPANPYDPTGGGQAAGQPGGYQPGAPLGNNQPRRYPVGGQISGGPGGASI